MYALQLLRSFPFCHCWLNTASLDWVHNVGIGLTVKVAVCCYNVKILQHARARFWMVRKWKALSGTSRTQDTLAG